MKSIFVFAAFLAMASATSLNPENIKDAEERFFVSSGGSNYLTLNSTLLLVALVALILLFGVVVLTASAVSSSRAQKKYDHQYEETFYADSENAHTRYRRFANDGNSTFKIFFLPFIN